MSKKMKLSLEDLKIKSFCTEIKSKENNDLKGGLRAAYTNGTDCISVNNLTICLGGCDTEMCA